MRPSPSSPYRLVVEGKDDQWAIINLLERHGYDWNDETRIRPFVHDLEGLDQVLHGIGPALKTYARFGVVIDADLTSENRWNRLRERLRSVGLDPPREIDPDGLVMSVSQPRAVRIGVWLMPDNRSPGTLEHFLATLVPAGDKVWPHAHAATSNARLLGAPLRESDQHKGAIHAWLAWQTTPGLPFGTSLQARVLGHESPEAVRFVSWFQRLFCDS